MAKKRTTKQAKKRTSKKFPVPRSSNRIRQLDQNDFQLLRNMYNGYTYTGLPNQTTFNVNERLGYITQAEQQRKGRQLKELEELRLQQKNDEAVRKHIRDLIGQGLEGNVNPKYKTQLEDEIAKMGDKANKNMTLNELSGYIRTLTTQTLTDQRDKLREEEKKLEHEQRIRDERARIKERKRQAYAEGAVKNYLNQFISDINDEARKKVMRRAGRQDRRLKKQQGEQSSVPTSIAVPSPEQVIQASQPSDSELRTEGMLDSILNSSLAREADIQAVSTQQQLVNPTEARLHFAPQDIDLEDIEVYNQQMQEGGEQQMQGEKPKKEKKHREEKKQREEKKHREEKRGEIDASFQKILAGASKAQTKLQQVREKKREAEEQLAETQLPFSEFQRAMMGKYGKYSFTRDNLDKFGLQDTRAGGSGGDNYLRTLYSKVLENIRTGKLNLKKKR